MIQDDSVEMFFDIAVDAIIEEHDEEKFGNLSATTDMEPVEINGEKFMTGMIYWNNREFEITVKEIGDPRDDI